MTASIMPMPKQAFFATVNGVHGPIVDGYVYFYESGTVTPKNAYTTAAGTTPTANPVRLNARGEPATGVFLGTGAYSIKLCDADDVEIWTEDGIEAAGTASAEAAAASAAEAAATAASLLTVADLYTLLENNRVPIGIVLPIGTLTVPSGYLPCDGTAVSRTTYAGLFAVIGTTFGIGDGITTFNVPDIRGEFLRGLDQGRGVDTARAIGSAQADALKAHTHTYKLWSPGGAGFSDGMANDGSTDSRPDAATSSTGDAETRPRNVALPYLIKAYDAVLAGANPPAAVQTYTGTAKTLALADRNTYIRCTSGSAVTITVPLEATVGFTVADEIHVMQAGTGTVTFAAAGGVTINASALGISGQWKAATLKKVAANTWDLFGALA